MADSTAPDTDKPPKASKPVKPPDPKPSKPKTSTAKKTDKPPTGGNDAKPKSSGKPAGRPVGMEKQLSEFFSTIGMVVSAFNANDGMIIASNADSLAKAWSDLAREDKRVKEAIEKMMKGSAWSGVIFATGSVAVAIAGNHGVFDGVSLFGGNEDEPPPPPPAPPTPGERPKQTDGPPPGLWQ